METQLGYVTMLFCLGPNCGVWECFAPVENSPHEKAHDVGQLKTTSCEERRFCELETILVCTQGRDK